MLRFARRDRMLEMLSPRTYGQTPKYVPSPMRFDNDHRVVMTLDAGGTNLAFRRIHGNRELSRRSTLPAHARQISPPAWQTLVEGLLAGPRPAAPSRRWRSASPSPARPTIRPASSATWATCPASAAACRWGRCSRSSSACRCSSTTTATCSPTARPSPASCPTSTACSEQAGSPKRYHNLFGVTLGTGFGGGIVRDGELFIGDNSVPPARSGCCATSCDPRLLRRGGRQHPRGAPVYAETAGMPLAAGARAQGDLRDRLRPSAGRPAAARDLAFRRLGEVAGDAMANALTLDRRPGGDRRRPSRPRRRFPAARWSTR